MYKNIPIYCINLERRKDRWSIFSLQPGVQTVSIKKIKAVDGKTLDIRNNSQISLLTKLNILQSTRRTHREINTPGAVGCTLSHVEVWKQFLDSKNEQCIVLEDDASIPLHFLEKVESCGTLPEGTDIWILSPKLRTPFTQLDGSWKIPGEFWGTSSYILTRKGAETLLKYVFPIECHLDYFFYCLHRLDKLNIVINQNLLLGVLGTGTDIQDGKCDLCNLPDSLKEYYIVKKEKIGVTIGIFSVVFVSYFLYDILYSRSGTSNSSS
jgi:GR25 family glycosyltransferase involved in LPS biosynthesis